jgi:serine protease Do
MKKLLFKSVLPGFLFLIMHVAGKAQEDNRVYSLDQKTDTDSQEIIIRKKGNKNTKVVIEIKDGKYFVNGKPLEKYDDGNISIVVSDPEGFENFDMAPVAPIPPMPPISISPFREDAMRQMRMSRDLANMNAAFLGVACKEAEKNGATVIEVTAGSAAEKAGLQKGDVITRVDDHKIDNPKVLTEVIRGYKPDQTVKLVFLRNGKVQGVTVKLQKMQMQEEFNFNYGNMNAPYYRGWVWKNDAPKIGLRVQDAEDGKGVTVLEVDEQSAAEKAGIKKGDIITALDGDAVQDADDLAEKVRDAQTKPTVKASVLRNGATQEIEIRIPRKLKKADL